MRDDELLAIYGATRQLAEGMEARNLELKKSAAALNEKTVALGVVIAELKQLPVTLGNHTSHYIGEGVRKAIQDDFTRPIADAVSGPMAQLDYAARQARQAIGEIKSESKLQNLTWVILMILLGVAIGTTGSYFFYTRAVGRINDRIDSIEQRMTPPAPAVDAKPTDGKPAKGKKGH